MGEGLQGFRARLKENQTWVWPIVGIILVLLIYALSTALHRGARLAVLAILGIAVLGYLFLLVIYRDEEATIWELLSDLLATPRSVVRSNITGDESLMMMTNPSWAAFFLEHLELLGLSVVLAASGIFLVYERVPWRMLLAYIFVASCYGVYFFYRRLDQWYTIYVFTNDRALVLTGVFNRSARSVQWRQVTNEGWDQPFVGRIFGYATLKLNSASEKAGPLEFADIPGRFKVNQLVQDRLEHFRR